MSTLSATSTFNQGSSVMLKKEKNISTNLLKNHFNKKRKFESDGFKVKLKDGAKKSFLSDAHVKNIIGEMNSETNKKLERLRLQQYYTLTINDFGEVGNQFDQSTQPQTDLAKSLQPNSTII